MSALRDYAHFHAEAMAKIGTERHALPYRLLLEHGEENTWSPLPEGEEYGYAKQCFGNAGKRVLFADADEGLTYYEGLTGPGFTVPHAWVQDSDGRVIELTLRHNDSRCPFCDGDGKLHPADHYDYYGDGDEDEFEFEEIECEMCHGSGRGDKHSREGTTYLGIPIPTEVLRESVVENGVWGVLFEDPERVEKALAS